MGRVGARPAKDRKTGADSGIDGYINFFDDNTGRAKRIVVQVKSGQVNRGQIAMLKGDMEREKAAIGLFITLNPPTRPMETEATSAGLYTPQHFPNNHYPRIQIITIEQLLSGQQPQYPAWPPKPPTPAPAAAAPPPHTECYPSGPPAYYTAPTIITYKRPFLP